MNNYWLRIENWIKAHLPGIIDTLQPAATPIDLQKLEDLVKLPLPQSFKDFLAVHNGQVWGTHLKLMDTDRLLSTEDIAMEWEGWLAVMPEINAFNLEMFGEVAGSEPDAGIKPDWWNEAWIPITSNGSGDSYCIDLDPADGGTHGQIIRLWHDIPDRELIAPSFAEWIDRFVLDLESGVYRAVDKGHWGGIVKPD